MKTIRVGIVGAGENTIKRHIPGLQAIEGVKIVSVCNRSDESSKRVAEKFAIEKTYGDWRELVKADDTDAIVIGTWPYLHSEITEFALHCGKHVLCEARMAMDTKQAHSMLKAARANPKLITQLVPAPETLQVDATVKKLIAAGYLGEILAINVRSGNTFLDKTSPLHWRQDIALVGYNHLSLGVWYETVMRLVGVATKVIAKGKIFITERIDESGMSRIVSVPEHLDVIADMSCGAQAHFQISKVTGLGGPNGAFLFGSEGTLKIQGDKLYGAKRGEQDLLPIAIAPELAGRWRVEEEFIGAIRGEEKIQLTTFEDGVKYMEFTDAVARSLETGEEVSVSAVSAGTMVSAQ
jgi:predicted dehydrogenase